MLFYPQRQHLITPDKVGLQYEDVYLVADDGIRLHGWKLLADKSMNQSTNRPFQGAVLFFHGNGENISTHFANVYWLTEHGYDVYTFDYRGYGKSEGETELDAMVADVEKMLGHVDEQLKEADRFIIIGYSFGSSLAIHAVANSFYRNSIDAFVSVSAFSDYRDVAQDVLATSWLTWLFQWPLSFTIDNSYRPLDSIAKLSPIPLLIIHSGQDQIVPFYHATRLYEAAAEPRHLLVVDSDHNHVFNNENTRRSLLEYIDAVVEPEP